MRDLGRAERARSAVRVPRRKNLPAWPAAVAKRLKPSQIDPVTGKLYWPSALQDSGFQAQRSVVDECTAKWIKYGGLDYADQTQVRENIDSMFDSLKSQIAAIPPQDYMTCRTFLQSLLYATTRTTL